ncbi:MAG: hypothetical protein KKH12_10920 [Gammaproteobacteria bacterium]|nr:hypothetical protein [Gammaproteobacteria bacterium]MBU1482169.1 hypothetical protein [Gammaproteobacteria bacterium]
MKKQLLIVFAVSIIAISTFSSAEVSGILKIAKIAAGNADNSFCIYSENNTNWVNATMCPGNYQYVACAVAPQTVNNKAKLALATSAFLAGRPVQIEANACCGTGVPCISEINVQ